MPRALARGRASVAGRARARAGRGIRMAERRRQPGRGAVALVAGGGGRVVGRFANGAGSRVGTVVAVVAAAGGYALRRRVGERCRRERTRNGVTPVAGKRRGDVSGSLTDRATGGVTAVVTSAATPGRYALCRRMRERGRTERGYVVTCIARQ